MKTFLQPRWVDFDDLVDVLPTLLCMFSTLGWDSFLTNHRVYYLDLVYEFYENIYLEDEKIFSMVQGRWICVSDKVFGGAVDLSYREKNVELVCFNNLVVCKIMLDMEDDPSD